MRARHVVTILGVLPIALIALAIAGRTGRSQEAPAKEPAKPAAAAPAPPASPGPAQAPSVTPAQAPSVTPAQAPTPINNEDCAVCHEDLAKAFDRNPHALLEKSPRHNLKNSCESCHGPGEAHATNEGDTTKIIGFTGSSAKVTNTQCLACHAKSHATAALGRSLHAKSGLSCAECHRVHGATAGTALLKTAPNRLCLDCHIQARTDFAKPYHHRVTENAMKCVDCHQPHGGPERRQMRSGPGGQMTCVKCHAEKAGPFVFEHASVIVRDCRGCHEPHGSNNPRMLVRSTVRSLCLECHSMSRSAALVKQPPAFHDVRSPRYQNCTTCHVRIHGSNASRIFLQ
jgi:DmsE family decaheme c-type cytochrome